MNYRIVTDVDITIYTWMQEYVPLIQKAVHDSTFLIDCMSNDVYKWFVQSGLKFQVYVPNHTTYEFINKIECKCSTYQYIYTLHKQMVLNSSGDIFIKKEHPSTQYLRLLMLSKPLNIGFGHQARVGKDESCSYIKEKYSADVLSFSQPLYHIMNHAYKTMDIPFSKDPEFLQYIGTWGRKKNPNVWVDTLCKKITPNTNVLVSDVRYKNEFNRLRELGFVLVKVTRPNRVIDRDPNHPSEIELGTAAWDYTINNDGTLQDLYNKLDDLVINLLYNRS